MMWKTDNCQAFLVGAFQMLALWPGFSRSGSTLGGGLLLGISRKAAADYSFIIAVPVMIVACFYDLLKSLSYLGGSDLAMIADRFCNGLRRRLYFRPLVLEISQ